MKILFVCIGNSCRSPAAKGLAEKWFKDHEIIFDSAGINKSASKGKPATKRMVNELKIQDIDLSGHRSKYVGEIEGVFDLVISMEQGVGNYVEGNYSGLGKAFIVWDVDDPYFDLGTDMEEETYQECLEVIEGYLGALYSEIKNR